MATLRVRRLQIQIDQELHGHVSSDSLSCSIFKVPNHLRRINENAYEPQVISIGPYHHGKPHLKAMEMHKKHYLKMLLSRMKENTVEKYLMALERLKEEALKFYSEPPNHVGGEDQFVKTMLFDGCFIVELIRKSAMKELREENDRLLTHFILRTVMRDLLLIENQLPFFILMQLFDMTKMSNAADQNFMHMAIKCLSIMMPGGRGHCNGKIENPAGIKHLLGLLHDSCIPPPDCEGSSDETRLLPHKPPEIVKSLPSDAVYMNPNLSSIEPGSSAVSMSQLHNKINDDQLIKIQKKNINHVGVYTHFASASFVRFPASKPSEENKSLPSGEIVMDVEISHASGLCTNEEKNGTWQTIRSASELREAGIKFQMSKGGLFDINFEKGVMSIPTLKIVDDTESILRNLVAYEQCYKDIPSRRFTDYIRFVDCLINTGKDVEFLRHKKVIENRLGDNEVVADIFNRICDSVLIDEDNFSYRQTFIKVNQHCERNWNRWNANLRHNYFNTPWALISFLAAVFLLLLTLMQSVYSALGYHHK